MYQFNIFYKSSDEINRYDKEERKAVFEIGKRFKLVKENYLTKEQYKKWIKDLRYSSRTAQRYIKVYERFGNMKAAEKFRVSTLFEMLSLNKSVDIKVFLSNNHTINGKTKKIEQMTREEVRNLVKVINGATLSNKKATPASLSVETKFNFTEEFSNTLKCCSSINEELLKELFDYFEAKLVDVLNLNNEQRKELLLLICQFYLKHSRGPYQQIAKCF